LSGEAAKNTTGRWSHRANSPAVDLSPLERHHIQRENLWRLTLPAGMTLEYLQSLLSADVGREVDVCLIDRTRLKPVIEGSGERWIA
jgi:hypothetical protein